MSIINTSNPPYIHLLTLPQLHQEVALFAYQLPCLPDFLADHTLLGTTPTERLAEVLSRFERFVIGLRKYRHAAYALRFISQPQRGAVDIYFIGRCLGNHGQAQNLAAQAASDLSVHLVSYNLEHIPVTESSIFQPFEKPPVLVEIRQHETLVPLLSVKKEAYVIHPYWGAVGACLEPFETLLRQSEPVILNIFLQPTEISNMEYEGLSEAAYIAQTVADLDIKILSDTGIRRRRDPGAELVGRIYSAYLKSLSEPFLTVVQVASLDANAAMTTAHSYAATMTSVQMDQRNEQGNALPSGTDIFTPHSQEDFEVSMRLFQQLIWSPWGESKASSGKERMPYLVGARGASTAFRFPVSVQGGVPGVAVRQTPPGFDPGPRPLQAEEQQLHLGSYQRGGMAAVAVRDLTRHTLITGFTGSGKTNTVLYLLDQIWRQKHIPFLVIEAAKKEYRSLARVKGFEDLLIFTLGDETTSPFRLNPFELLAGVRLEAHLGKVQACFDAALPQFGILPSIIAEAMEEIYKVKGWKLTDRATENETRLFPTMRDLFAEVIRVAERRGYAGETFHNIRAAAAGRIGSLLRGSKGRMFGGQRSFPAEIIFKRPVILELNDLNEDDKALTMMFLLTWLREYRELHPDRSLQHLTVVEEAHNVLSNVSSVGNSEVSADTKAKAVAAFTNMLSEVRSYGEGLVISDQSPEKLAPDALRNTNLQIAHQLRDRHDRQSIGRAMIMDESQQDYLGKLRVGEAAIFRTGLEKATFITIAPYKDAAGFDHPPRDEDVQKHMQNFRSQYFSAALPFDGCRFCATPCIYQEIIEPQTMDKEQHERFRGTLMLFNEHPEAEHWPENWRQVSWVCVEAARQAGQMNNLDAAYCYFVHEIDFPFTEHMRKAFEQAIVHHFS